MQPLTVTQLKAVKELVDAGIEDSKAASEELDAKRLAALRQIGNIVHDSVVVHDDEVRVCMRLGRARSPSTAETHVCVFVCVYARAREFDAKIRS